MNPYRRFAAALGVWTLALVFPLAGAVFAGAVFSPVGTAPDAAGVVASLVAMAAAAVPVASLLAGISAARALDGRATRRAGGEVVGVALAACAAAFALHALDVALDQGGGAGALGALSSRYAEAAAQARAEPRFTDIGWSAPWQAANTLGWKLHFAYAGSVLAGVAAATGALLGMWLRGASGPPREWAAWAAAAGFALYLAVAMVMARETTQQLRFPPAFAAWAVLAVPAAVLLALAGPVMSLRALRARHAAPPA
jgi:hypothetical protein